MLAGSLGDLAQSSASAMAMGHDVIDLLGMEHLWIICWD